MIEQNLASSLRLLMSPGDEVELAETTILSIEELPAVRADDETRPEQTLELVDMLAQSRRERKDFLLALEDQYPLMFQERIDPLPTAVSVTAREGILYALDGTAYVARQRPVSFYNEQRLCDALQLQTLLSEYLPYVPPLLLTRTGAVCAQVQNATYVLTPSVSGEPYIGKREQSLAAAHALGEMHALALRLLPAAAVVADSREKTSALLTLVARLDVPDRQMQQGVIAQMKEALSSIDEPDTSLNGWLHGDFSPVHLVFRRNTVIAVNDFENVVYGPPGRDIARCVLTHCGVDCATAASPLHTPILTTLDTSRARGMISAYMQSSGVPREACVNIASQMVYLWFELLAVGLLRGDVSFAVVGDALPFWRTLWQKVNEVLAWL